MVSPVQVWALEVETSDEQSDSELESPQDAEGPIKKELSKMAPAKHLGITGQFSVIT